VWIRNFLLRETTGERLFWWRVFIFGLLLKNGDSYHHHHETVRIDRQRSCGNVVNTVNKKLSYCWESSRYELTIRYVTAIDRQYNRQLRHRNRFESNVLRAHLDVNFSSSLNDKSADFQQFTARLLRQVNLPRCVTTTCPFTSHSY